MKPSSARSVCDEPVSDESVSDEPDSNEPVSDESVSSETVSNELVCAKPIAVADQTLSNLLPRTAQTFQNATINVVVNYGNHPKPQLNLGPGQEWEVSYEKCKRIGERLDLHENWKMLASKLKFDRAIDGVAQLASNNHTSPTVEMLREWMLVQNKGNRGTCYKLLIKALTDMGRNDIIDDVEDSYMDNVDDSEDCRN